jgi:predicted nucleotide-binding protein
MGEDWSNWTNEQLEQTLFKAQPGSVNYEKAKYLLDKRRHAEGMATKSRAKQETAASLDSTQALSILRRLHERGTALMAKRPVQKNDVDAWASTGREMLIKAFGSDSHNVNDFTQVGFYREPSVDSPSAWEEVRGDILSEQLSVIGSCIEQLELIGGGSNEDKRPISTTPPLGTRIFIGHGSDPTWREVKDFIVDRLKLGHEEFNRESTAGIPTVERLQTMLSESAFALIVMTGEDEHADGKRHPRENVIHELGLFQGHLGFHRAIILLEEECEEFSNIEGITQIRFTKGQVSAAFENIRRAVERERPDLLRN